MKQEVIVIVFACVLSVVVIGLIIRAFLKGTNYLNRETEEDYTELFYKAKWINFTGALAMCGCFITAAAVSETHILATLIMLCLVILFIVIPKVILQVIWRCPNCGSNLTPGINKGINIQLVGQCPECKKVLCKALHEEHK